MSRLGYIEGPSDLNSTVEHPSLALNFDRRLSPRLHRIGCFIGTRCYAKLSCLIPFHALIAPSVLIPFTEEKQESGHVSNRFWSRTMKRLIPLIPILVASPALADTVTQMVCTARLADISAGRMSGDDTLVLSDCAVNGFISTSDIERAYDRAKRAAQ